MSPKKAIKFFVIWLIVFAVFSFAISFSASVYAFEHHLDKKDLPEQFKLIISGILLLCFCPSLAFVHRCAKIEANMSIQKTSLFLLLILLVASIGYIISVLF